MDVNHGSNISRQKTMECIKFFYFEQAKQAIALNYAQHVYMRVGIPNLHTAFTFYHLPMIIMRVLSHGLKLEFVFIVNIKAGNVK